MEPLVDDSDRRFLADPGEMYYAKHRNQWHDQMIEALECKSFYFMGGNLTSKWAVKRAIRYRNVFVSC